MCNKECPENTPCCLCKWNQDPYQCHNVKCGKNADFCQQEIAEQISIAIQEARQEPPEAPYEYVELKEEYM